MSEYTSPGAGMNLNGVTRAYVRLECQDGTTLDIEFDPRDLFSTAMVGREAMQTGSDDGWTTYAGDGPLRAMVAMSGKVARVVRAGAADEPGRGRNDQRVARTGRPSTGQVTEKDLDL